MIEWMQPGLEVSIRVVFRRIVRGRCGMCGLRRVLFVIEAGDQRSVPLCAKCAGIR